ncbi:universal stress protein [Natrarchaeobius sp. A-rgal3]|uniref:universal stress protein n=1 Tax=Natrarchaeobius versutus TaxID=1679078 RepID=UPI003510876E
MVVVAAVDRSDRASNVVDEAGRLADAFDEPLYVLHVSTESAYDKYDQSSQERIEDVDEEQIREAAADVAAEAIADGDVSAEPVGLIGDPSSTIVTYANDHDAEYVVLAPRKRSPTGKAVFGSVAQSVILNAECPVVTSVDQ